MAINVCPVCDAPLTAEHITTGDFFDLDCPNCGSYRITGSAFATVGSQTEDVYNKKHLISHSIRRRSLLTKSRPEVTTSWIDNVLEKASFPNPLEQSRNLILWAGDTLKYKPDEWASIDFYRSEIATTIGSRHGGGVNYVLCLLHDQKYLDLKCQMAQEGPINITGFRMTYKGWEYFEEISRHAKDSRIAFMAMQFGNKKNGGENYIVERAVNKCFRKAVEATDFRLKKVTDEQPSGLIDDHIIVGIRMSRFLIVDLTNHNKGAYWEAGFAEGLGKPVIYTCHQKHFKASHFDTNHRKTILWNELNWEKASQDLKDTIRATLPDEARMED